MQPSILVEILETDSKLSEFGLKKRIYEDTSLDKRPTNDGIFIVISPMETLISNKAPLDRGPRNFIIAVHEPMHSTRSFEKINAVIERITVIYNDITQLVGEDGIRVTSIKLVGKSRQFTDPGWQTLTRNATYGVLYQESEA